MTDPADPDEALADTFDDPSYNPFAEEKPPEDEEGSVASQQLRDNFIRLTTQAPPQEPPQPQHYYNPPPNTIITTTTTNNNSQYNYNHALVGAPTDYDYSQYNTNGYVLINTTQQGQSLARAPTTPQALATLLPVACIVTHALFLYGQVAPMWNLAVTAEDINIWANATSTTSYLIFDSLSLDRNFHYQHATNHTVKEFTYGYAVQELWEAKGIAMPGALLAKIAALGLVIFSGIWPHVKLLLLNHAWVTPTTNPNRRTQTLGWLALLGKWSLADVLTVCVMVGVLNIEWKLDPAAIKEGIFENLHTLIGLASQVWGASDVCGWALKKDMTDCNKVAALDMPKCRLCKSFVNQAYNNPELVEQTGKSIVRDIRLGGGWMDDRDAGAIRLSVKGMKGIYYFCAAVIFSVLLSVVVEWYNHLYLETLRQQHKQQQQQQEQSHTLSLTEEDETSPPPPPVTSASSAVSNDSDASEPLLLEDAPPRFEPMEIMDDDQSVFNGFVERTTSNPTYQWFQCHYIMPTITLLFVGLAVYLPSMERHVGGGIPDLLKDVLGIEFDKTYSLASLKDTTGAAGGWDLMLMATFGLFCVLGPLLRAILVVLVAMTKRTEDTKRIRSLLVRVSNFLAAFCAWEVFLVAMIMVELIMPTATDTILNTPACHIIAKDGGSCLKVAYERVHTTFACLVLGFILIGGLSIHVSLQDKKEQSMDGDEDHPTIRTLPQGPPPEIDTTPSYALETITTVSEEMGELNSIHTNNDGTAVTTMFQQEMV